MAAAQQSQSKQSNFVAQDMIWKAHIKKELETTKRWPEDWGFLTMPCDEVENEKGGREVKKLTIPEHLQVRPTTPVEKYIKVDPSPAVPPTTQGLVGWRSSVPKHALERYGKTNYLKGDFCKRMNWPAEGIA
ncbi:ciliary microtubule inner protein 1 isoform X3 [Hyperolius riggenbachi]|uniref:ciliary microtubule inner protein 1 isoform X3 n=1 Tax=Hyperolius riggenbachi TaxID=752182 RepID=UPI0035A2C194